MKLAVFLVVQLQLCLLPLFTFGISEGDVQQFFRDALQCIDSIQRERTYGTHNQNRLYRELSGYTQTLYIILSMTEFSETTDHVYRIMIEELYSCFKSVLEEYIAMQRSSESTPRCLIPPTRRTGCPGRPQYDITSLQISHCISIGMNWQQISSAFGIDRRTLYRHRQHLGIQPLQYTVLTDQDLRQIISDILQRTPNVGESYVRGGLSSRQMRVQRWRVRQCLQACGINELIMTIINLHVILTVPMLYP